MPNSSSSGPGIVAKNYKTIGKNTLVGKVDLEITGWKLIFKGCLHCEKNGKEWISFPANEYTDKDGNKKYSDVIEFSDKAVHNRFQKAALAAVHEVLGGP